VTVQPVYWHPHRHRSQPG